MLRGFNRKNDLSLTEYLLFNENHSKGSNVENVLAFKQRLYPIMGNGKSYI